MGQILSAAAINLTLQEQHLSLRVEKYSIFYYYFFQLSSLYFKKIIPQMAFLFVCLFSGGVTGWQKLILISKSTELYREGSKDEIFAYCVPVHL